MRSKLLCLLSVLMLMMPAAWAQEGAWGQINTDLTRAEGWQRIVTPGEFALGEKTLIGEVSGQDLFSYGYGTYPCIDGSTVSMAMVMEFAWQHQPVSDDDIPGFVFLSTTHMAYEHLIKRLPNGSAMVASEMAVMDESHPVDMIIATEPSDEERAMAKAHGVELVIKPVCLDAFVFITHRDNPVSSLTIDQIRGIYKGEITNWMEVGGLDAPIRAYRREKNSGSETAMELLVMQGEEMKAENNYITGGMEGLVRRIGDYENGIESLGYTYLYYINNLYLDENIKTIAVEGFAPDAANIRSGAYPYSTAYYGVIRRGEEEGTGGRFLDWMLSDEGQKCIAQAGYQALK